MLPDRGATKANPRAPSDSGSLEPGKNHYHDLIFIYSECLLNILSRVIISDK